VRCASVEPVSDGAIRIGVLGLGSVFYGPYMAMIERLAVAGRAHVTAVYDSDEGKRRAAGLRLGLDPGLTSPDAVIESDDVDVVLVLTSMPVHGALANSALAAGKHVLVEKPMATSLEEAAALMQLAAESPGHLICAPHIVLSPTFRAVSAHVENGDIGRLLLARARYGWSGPDWGRWFYERGGGALFDLGVYNVTALCALFGPAQRVTAMAGVAIPERVVEGETMQVQAEDNAHVLIDFGEARFASVTTGFTMQRYRSPAIELYGSDGVLQLLGDDWAPEGYELWRNAHGAWELFPESDPGWQWTEGLRHLVDCIETGRAPVTRPEHAYHALEIMLAAQAAAADGRARAITSDFPRPDLAALELHQDGRRVHDPRSALL
jgi:predicted dehydrogenase